MKAEFYDVKTRKMVKADVTEKVVYGKKGRERYAIRAVTKDGRNLTKFVSKVDWEKMDVPEGKPKKKSAAKKKK